MRKILSVGLANGLLALLGMPLTANASTNVACAVDALQQIAPSGTTLSSAKLIAASKDIPEHCLVDGTVATPGNTVKFALGLPTKWNGKFFFQGVGGFAGQVGRLNAGLQRGYASASTDTGHQGSSGTDASWALNNRAKVIDYAFRGTHVTAVAAKQLTRHFYNVAPHYSYFSGCSNGGRQALMEAQRYPDDFDGIVAGDPGFGALGFVRRVLNYQFMLASPDRVLSPAKLEILSKAALAACDKSDGVTDGLIGDPRVCKFDPAPLACKGAEGPECLTKGQLETAKMIYNDVTSPRGERILGFPYGHEAGATGWQAWITGKTPPTKGADGRLTFDNNPPIGYRFADGFFRYMAFDQDDSNYGKDYDWRAFDLKRDLPKIQTVAKLVSPTDADLSKLQKHGGKLLMYHGWADPAISAYGSIDYYNKVVQAAGGKQQADNFVRLFMAPGMHHCAGGPGPNSFDTLTALEQWVEKKTPPARLIASHSTAGKVDRTRPLCPEPQVAHYNGSGSIDAAENFSCR